MDRDRAFQLVQEHVGQRNLVYHCVAAECIMAALAARLGATPAERGRWALAGLLHDLDHATTAEDPARHGVVSAEMLGDTVEPEITHAILAHADKAPRETLMDKALFAADPTTGFIVAAALVRPDKDMHSVEVSSLLKRWKEKSFARGASREQMDTCSDIGLTRDEFLALSLAAMQERAAEIGF